MSIGNFLKSKKGAGASSTFDTIMVVGSVVITGVFIIYFLTHGLELVHYYQQLNPRLTAESMAGLAAALSVAPADMNLTYDMKTGPESGCKLIFWGNGNNIFTGVNIGTVRRDRFSKLLDLINNKIPEECKGLSGEEAEECLKTHKTEDGATLGGALVDLAFGPDCPQSTISRLRDEIGEKFHNRNKKINPDNLIAALDQLVVGSCRNMVIVKGEEENVVIQLDFKSAVVSAPSPEGIDVVGEGRNEIECNDGVKFVLFKKDDKIGINRAIQMR